MIMDLKDLVDKYIQVELRNGKKVKGILTAVKDYEDGDFFYTALQIRVKEDDYKIIYLIEVDSIGEII